MRLYFCSMAASLLVMLGSGCNTVSPDECWPNTSGGFGGSGTIPIGAGVGATSGDFLDPPRGPLDYDDEAPNPCVTPSSPDEGSELGTYIRCLGLGPTACTVQCNAIGAPCVEFTTHPEDPNQSIGTLKQCMDNMLSSTYSYCYSNGDVCTFIYARFGIGKG